MASQSIPSSLFSCCSGDSPWIGSPTADGGICVGRPGPRDDAGAGAVQPDHPEGDERPERGDGAGGRGAAGRPDGRAPAAGATGWRQEHQGRARSRSQG